jgi:large subunit ribosomal protein L18
MKRIVEKRRRRLKRKKSIRKRISGTHDRPRMSVFRSNQHMYVQVIDDTVGKTIASASSMEKEHHNLKNTVEDAGKLGKVIGERLKKKKIEEVVFDRNAYLFHGVVKAIADGAREAGIKF